ncbi:hypothetical protein FB45DRAFT_905528 [Roridomyces roridus]|uniref:Uncharacterized protein n=1 Tax=Roridomyces roridus TaxID=1738132 RepID=A0AAD7FS27_9AGAR|nr:hypothetical protein FB45DRAFT_905528 [Roridomyces roridus]
MVKGCLDFLRAAFSSFSLASLGVRSNRSFRHRTASPSSLSSEESESDSESKSTSHASGVCTYCSRATISQTQGSISTSIVAGARELRETFGRGVDPIGYSGTDDEVKKGHEKRRCLVSLLRNDEPGTEETLEERTRRRGWAKLGRGLEAILAWLL